jgi:hypothetical protein
MTAPTLQERLRYFGALSDADVCVEAADELSRLRDENEALKGIAFVCRVCHETRKENEALREALHKIVQSMVSPQQQYPSDALKIAQAALAAASGEGK